MWFNRNQEFADATFVDYGAADAFAVAAKALPALVKALEQIAAMDPKGIRADDLGRAARTANEALLAAVGTTR
jgi:spore maturation protein SpmB